MRLFVAVPIAEDIIRELTTVQERLRRLAVASGVRVKWVEPGTFHLTVAFLGELSVASIPDISDACSAVAMETSPFRVQVGGVSVFPKASVKGNAPIKTIWTGLTGGASEWGEMARRAEPYFVPFGAAKDGGLVPHITMGRVKTERGGEEPDTTALREALLTEASVDCGAMQADTLLLIESVLDPRGATYREVARWRFGKTTKSQTSDTE